MICNDHSEFPKYRSPKYQGGQKKLNIKIDSNIIIEAIKYFIEGKLNNEQIYLMDNEWSFKDGQRERVMDIKRKYIYMS